MTVAAMRLAGAGFLEGQAEGDPLATAVLGVGVFNEIDAQQVAQPLDDWSSDWMGYVPFVFANTAAGSVYNFSGSEQIEINSKRRMDELGMRLWCVWDTSSLGTGTVLHIRYVMSVLLLLP